MTTALNEFVLYDHKEQHYDRRQTDSADTHTDTHSIWIRWMIWRYSTSVDVISEALCEQENMSAPCIDMLCGRPSSCQASTVTAAPSGERVCIFYISSRRRWRRSLLWSFSEFFYVRWPWPLTFTTENCTPIALRNVYTNTDFSTFFCFRVSSPNETDGQRDGRAKRAMRPTGRSHSKIHKVQYVCHCRVFALNLFVRNIQLQNLLEIQRMPIITVHYSVNAQKCVMSVIFQMRSG